MSRFTMYQKDGYVDDNAVSITEPPKPASLYTSSFRASVGDQENYLDNYVKLGGHPVYVEYTIDYERKKHYSFRLVGISATSSHPVRNTHDYTIIGDHTLWESANSASYKDGDRGSFHPNVFGYKFNSSVPDASVLRVTILPKDLELVGASAILIGTVDGREVIKSDYFFFKSFNPITVDAHVIRPNAYKNPFTLNADVDWGVRLHLSGESLQREGEGVTRLELYWVAETRHRAFQDYFPIKFLRAAVKQMPARNSWTRGAMRATHTSFCAYAADEVFDGFHKRYDTIAGESLCCSRIFSYSSLLGASQFNMSYWGGNFALNRYLDGQTAGERFRTANCMDQAGMLELFCSVEHPTGWLSLAPFGYIKTTNLVGVKNTDQNLIDVNNPFFEANASDPVINDVNDHRRYYFGMHVFNVDSRAFDPQGDSGIYDACGGPHRGTETIREYLDNSIDNTAALYQNMPAAGPGTYLLVSHGYGVAAIDGPPLYPPGHDTYVLPTALNELAATSLANIEHPVAHQPWVYLDHHLKGVLGDTWDVRYMERSVTRNAAQVFWHICDVNTPDNPIRVQVDVFSVVDKDGNLDLGESATFSKWHIQSLLMSTQRADVWAIKNLPDIGNYLHYGDQVSAGRIVLAVKNVVIDIAGTGSTAELLPHALKLLSSSRWPGPSGFPTITMSPSASNSEPLAVKSFNSDETIKITGIHTRFTVTFSLRQSIAAASAQCISGDGVLFDRYTTNGDDLIFSFITNKVGSHSIHMCYAHPKTMFVTSFDREVHVSV
ncbi:hypothetical protein H0H93_016485 [Arthromyces matolae]|nr:hypothetical protein H0H93_016485 [Arthromyces matolae]